MGGKRNHLGGAVTLDLWILTFLDARRTLNAPMEPGQRFSFAMNLSWFGGERGFLMYEGAYTNDRLKISHGGSDALWVNGEQAFANVYNQALTVTMEAVRQRQRCVTPIGKTQEGRPS